LAYIASNMREEFENQLIQALLKKFDLTKDINLIDAIFKQNSTQVLTHIKSALMAAKSAINKKILLLIILKAKMLNLRH